MKIVQIASEAVPFAKTGGLGDVAGALSEALAREGYEVALIIPYYTTKISTKKHKIRDTKTTINVSLGNKEVNGEVFTCKLSHNLNVYLIKQEEYFNRSELYQTPEGDYPDNAERFIFFSRAAIALSAQLKPAVIHVHDWQTAMIPVFLKAKGANTKTLLTIHNLGYQGLFPHTEMPKTGLPWEFFTFDKLEFYGKLNFLKGGMVYADAISTVSKKYAEEILTPEYGCGLEGVLNYKKGNLYGIVNGIDYGEWNPATDRYLPQKYDEKNLAGKALCKAHLQRAYKLPVKADIPLIGVISRLTSQKGFDLLEAVMPELVKQDIQMAVLGTGEKKYHEMLLGMAREYPQKFGVRIAFDNALAHQIEAGSDLFLMPSRYEPCGLNQLISLKYGTIPVVRATGGLDDTIKHRENGFKFSQYEGSALLGCIYEALSVFKKPEQWKKIMASAFASDFSWGASARAYIELYKRLF